MPSQVKSMPSSETVAGLGLVDGVFVRVGMNRIFEKSEPAPLVAGLWLDSETLWTRLSEGRAAFARYDSVLSPKACPVVALLGTGAGGRGDEIWTCGSGTSC